MGHPQLHWATVPMPHHIRSKEILSRIYFEPALAGLQPLCLVLSLHAHEKRPSPAFLWALPKYWEFAMITLNAFIIPKYSLSSLLKELVMLSVFTAHF